MSHHAPHPAPARLPPQTKLLRQISYFAGLEAATLAEIARAVRPREAEDGEHILTAGEPCLGLYFVIAG